MLICHTLNLVWSLTTLTTILQKENLNVCCFHHKQVQTNLAFYVAFRKKIE
jgi:hypothetical protein